MIERASFADPWSSRDFRDALAAGVTFLVGVTDTAVLGYVIARHAADAGEILNLAVVPESRGRGVGQALVTCALTHLRVRGVAAVYLEVRESNAVARRLYQRLGFQEVGRRAGYYRRPREDAVVLRTAIPAVQGDAKL